MQTRGSRTPNAMSNAIWAAVGWGANWRSQLEARSPLTSVADIMKVLLVPGVAAHTRRSSSRAGPSASSPDTESRARGPEQRSGGEAPVKSTFKTSIYAFLMWGDVVAQKQVALA